MALWRFVKLDLKEAQQLLADLTGVENDLEATKAICELLMKELRESQPEWQLIEALTAAALVRYARSFTTGVRRIPEDVLSCLSPNLLEAHNWFKDLRHKYIAHSVNAFEENQVVAYLIPEESGTKGVSSISVQQTRLASLGSKDIKKLKEICSELRKHIMPLIEAEKSKVLSLAQKLPLEELYNQKDPPTHILKEGDVKKQRKRY